MTTVPADESQRLQSVEPVAAPKEEWTRTRECAAQADKLAARSGLDSDKNVLGRQNHYSSTYQRCYVEISYFNAEAQKQPKLLPLMYYELWDAFEGTNLAMCTDGAASGNGLFCSIQNGGKGLVDCSVCRSFVKERMTH